MGWSVSVLGCLLGERNLAIRCGYFAPHDCCHSHSVRASDALYLLSIGIDSQVFFYSLLFFILPCY